MEAPHRVLRKWLLLGTADDELHRVTLPPSAEARLQQLAAITAELERWLSPALAGDLRRLIGQSGTVPPTLAELRLLAA